MPIRLSKYHEQLKIKEISGRTSIFDPVRKKWLIATPEEIVRQSVIQYLVVDKGYPLKRIQVERTLSFHNLSKRFDIAVCNKAGQAEILVECKAPTVRIDDTTIEQISTYNEVLQVSYIWITNGPDHLIVELDYYRHSSKKIADLPKAQ